MKRLLLFLIIVCGTFKAGRAQSSRNLYGREFWVTFTENLIPDTFNHLLVTPMVADTIKVFNPQLGLAALFPVKPGIQNLVRIPKTSLTFWYSPASFTAQNTGVVVTSKMGDFALQAVNTVTGSTDVASVLPMQILSRGREYLIHTTGGNSGKESEAAVIAIDTGTTTIEITAGCFIPGIGITGTVKTFNLKYGQVFAFRAQDTQNLTGTFIRVKKSCKRIAVFAGAKCAKVPDQFGCNGCDVLYEQLYPTWAFGKDYFVPPVPDNKSWYVGVEALYDNTSVVINGTPITLLNKGQFILSPQNGPCLVNTDKPSSCIQVLKSSGCNGAAAPSYGDPSYLVIPPISAGVTTAGTSVYRNPSYNSNKIILTSQTFNVPVIKMNGVPIWPASFQKFVIGGKAFWYGAVWVTFNKTWAFAADSAFLAYQYGQGNYESFATCIGAGFPNSNVDFSATPNPVCNPATEITFTAKGDSLGNFTWFFGDGSKDTGNTVKHIYNKTGFFKAGIANPSYSGCIDSISLSISVLQAPQLNLPKDTQPCVGSIYRIQLPTNLGYSYLWENGSTSYFQTIGASRTAIVKATDTQGCFSTDTIKVNYRDCNDYDLRLANVFTPNNDGFNDEWRVIYKAYKKIDISIFNRWGEIMYKYQLPDDEQWNGKVNNQFTVCPEGVYFYRLVATEVNGKKKELVGSIELIR